MKINTAQSIDWYSITYPFETKTSDILPKDCPLELKRIKSPIPVYSIAYEVIPYGIKVLRGLERLGLHVIYSGKTLLALREDGITDLDIWQTMQKNEGKLSRIDFALDIFDDEELNVNNVKAAHDNGECQTKLKGSKFIGEAQEFETLYIGNWKSKARRFRVYNKGIEQMVDYLWVRIEYEKRRQATNTARSHFVHNDSIASIIKSAVDFPEWERWQLAFNAEPSVTHRDEKPLPDWVLKLNWLLDSATPALANTVLLEAQSTEGFVLEDSVVLNTFAASLSAELRKRFHGRGA